MERWGSSDVQADPKLQPQLLEYQELNSHLSLHVAVSLKDFSFHPSCPSDTGSILAWSVLGKLINIFVKKHFVFLMGAIYFIVSEDLNEIRYSVYLAHLPMPQELFRNH